MLTNKDIIETKTYPIYLNATMGYKELSALLKSNSFSQVFVLVDDQTEVHCLGQLQAQVEELKNAPVICTPSGEINKNFEALGEILRALSKENADRSALLINLGAGLITDIGGFSASIYKRGIACVNIPTSLLAMVDASVGGKTGIDLDQLKNQVGTFSFPKAIIVDAAYLRTLAPNELVSGFAEMLKHGLIADANLWAELIGLDHITIESIEPFIARSIEIKKEVVESDPTEKGLRKILNFGHSLGHAVESFYLNSDRAYLHGEAIAIGMIGEAFLSHQLLGLDKNSLEQIGQYLLKTFPIRPIDVADFEAIQDWLKHDKKNNKGLLKFSLIDQIGNCLYDIEVSQEQVRASMTYYNTLFN